MIFWHLGGATFLFRWIFRDPKVDLRFLALGALAADAIDLIIGVVMGDPTRQRLGHALVTPSLVTVAVLLVTGRGRRRKMWMTVVVAWLFHLLLDGIWVRPETLFWPFFGWSFAAPAAGGLIERALADPWRWVKEAVGLVYLGWLGGQLGWWAPAPTED